MGATTRARYVLPSFTERTSFGEQETNPYSKLFAGRIVFLGTPIDDAAANDVLAQLICLESMQPDRPISLYINSPGGSLTAMAAIYDTMQYIRCELHTFCLGQASSAAAVLLAAGAPGRRSIVPNARVLLHQPEVGGFQGQVSDLEIQAGEVSRLRSTFEATIAHHTGRRAEQVRTDIERELVLDAKQAVAYGLVDAIIDRH
ncbi:ATP-dependent Clp protease proteolytic subunit [Pseudonocardia sp. GCM10023141]|uniref:ATP-dependent Clp protease proteolytic subunit n=1 Tax=Pseudonocardia sp. GCM10023141 TaxID=3252653 RepID=UPI0036222161